jgi:peptide/nickel transport system substrate-binding protein
LAMNTRQERRSTGFRLCGKPVIWVAAALCVFCLVQDYGQDLLAAQAPASRKATLTVAFPSNPETIDPHQFRAVLTGSVLGLMVEGLLFRDPDTMEIKPKLATSYRNIDPLTWEFSLRKGVKFNNGEEFNAESVKFTVERIIESKLNTLGKVVWPPSIGQQVHIVNPHTVRITTKVPDPLLPNRLAAESLNMCPPKALAEFKEKFVTNKVIGTGPYKFVEFVVGDRLVVEANPDYWGPKPATQRIVFQVIPDAATSAAALQRGAVDLVVNLPIPLISAVKNDPNLSIFSQLGSTVHVLLLNTKESVPLRDRRVRQALSHAIDREAILKNLYAGHGKPLNSVVARQVTYAIDPPPYSYDPAKAKRLLAEAGYPNGFELTLWQAIGRWVQAEEAAQSMAGYFEKIGVKTNLKTLEWGEYNRRSGRTLLTGASYYAFVNGLWDPEYVTQRFLPTYPSYRYYDAAGELRDVIAEYSQTFDPAKRKELAARVQKGLQDEAGWLALWQIDEIFGISKKVKGFKMRPDHLLWLNETYVEP